MIAVSIVMEIVFVAIMLTAFGAVAFPLIMGARRRAADAEQRSVDEPGEPAR